MSTEQQDLSPAIQKRAIEEYAIAHGLRVVATYEDQGKSGMRIANRLGMRRLLSDVASPECPFGKVLVYDVSRWGRFQDADAAAYYEYTCRLHGVEVIYVAEGFGAHAGPLASLLKNLKRMMAAEYSRELAVKVRAGQIRVIEMGYSAGGQPALGLVRQAVTREGVPRAILKPGERKGVQSDRVRLIPGPPEEVALLRRIFQLYANTHLGVNELVRLLQHEGHKTSKGTEFTTQVVQSLLSYEPFVGDYVWARLGQTPAGTRRRPAEERVRREGVIEPLIDRKTWDKVQAKRRARTRVKKTKDQMIRDLAAALKRSPTLTAPDLPVLGCSPGRTYIKTFGSMEQAYALAGRKPGAADMAVIARIQRTQAMNRAFRQELVEVLRREGATVHQDLLCHVILVNDRWRVKVQVVWRRSETKQPAWYVPRHHDRVASDFRLVVRLNDDGTTRDYLLVPQQERESVRTILREEHENALRRFRFKTLVGLAERLLQGAVRTVGASRPRRT